MWEGRKEEKCDNCVRKAYVSKIDYGNRSEPDEPGQGRVGGLEARRRVGLGFYSTSLLQMEVTQHMYDQTSFNQFSQYANQQLW